MIRHARTVFGAVLLTLPLTLALVGPAVAGEPPARSVPFTTDGTHLFGTDFVGRDVWREVLLGGRSVVVVALLATALAYLVGVPMGMLAAMTHHRLLDDLLMRPLDLLLAIPSLLLLILLAATAPRSPLVLVGIVALVGLPEVVRISRTAALRSAHSPVMEAMRLQGEGWWRRGVGHVGRNMLRVLVADAGVRLVGALYLVASASFLGVGVAPDASDWAVMVDRNRSGLFLQPWAVVIPALLIVFLSVGANLTFDRALAGRDGQR